MDRAPENEHPTSESAENGGTADTADVTTDAADTAHAAPEVEAEAETEAEAEAEAENTDANPTVILTHEPVNTDAFDTVVLTPVPSGEDANDTVRLTPAAGEADAFDALGIATARQGTSAYDTLAPPAPHTGAATPRPVPPEPSTDDIVTNKRERDPDDQRWWATLLALPAGVFAAAIGLGPWVLTGARLPAQDLWVTATPPGAMPFALLPLSQNTVIPVFSYLVVGAALAGILGRVLHLRGVGLFLLELGVLGVQGWATVQATMVLRDGLQDRFEAAMYIVGLLTGTVLSILCGVLVTMLVAAAPRAGALLGLTAGAIGTTAWMTTLLFATGFFAGPFSELAWLLPWLAPTLTGLAIAWTGVNTVGRVLSTIVALAMIWLAPAVATAVANALGNRVVFRSGEDLLAYGADVFRSALLVPEVSLPPVIGAAAIAAVVITVVLIVRALVRERPITESRT